MKRILIIDDDIHIGNMLEEALTRAGYKILRAYSGTEALLVLSSSNPDLVLPDLMLPGLSGEEVLPKIRGIPVIVISAKVDVDNKVDLLLGGAADYVTKPFDTKELYLAFIQNRTEALKQLTEELFRYSVIISAADEMRFETVDVNGVLEESIALFYAALTERGITPAIRMPEQKILRDLDRAALSRVFGNVLNNALKYSDGDLDIALLESGEIIFTNTAAELDEVQVGKLFDRFFSVEAARNSTGLGLAISKTLVAQMNGIITAQYKDGKLSICMAFKAVAPGAAEGAE